MIQAVFFDIDGTLVSFQTHTIPDPTRRALFALRERGVKLFIATGRPPVSLGVLRRGFDFEFDAYITINGQYCCNRDGVIYERTLPPDSIRRIVPYMEREQIACSFVELERTYYNLVNDKVRTLNRMLGEPDKKDRVEDVSQAHLRPIYQLSPYVSKWEEGAFLEHMPGCKAVRWHDIFMDAIPVDGGKPVGMDRVLEYYGIDLADTMAFGDGGNDVDMLRHAGIGVAMGNALDEAKQAADYVTDTVDEEGVANALKHFGLID